MGSRHSRFTAFVRGPRVVLAYARGLLAGAKKAIVGHNPMGGWSVVAMLVSLLLQAGTGLFANDDIITEGPLARHVSKALSDRLTAVHNINANILYVLIALHLAAVIGYLVLKKENLIRPMLTGLKALDASRDGDDTPFVSSWRAMAIGIAAAALVWAVVSR
jgi:cytochrome b